MATAAAWLESRDEARVVLEDVNIEGQIQGLTANISLTQTYRNTEARNIEAVYTFPLPLDAVLLELSLTLNGETLTGVVQARAEAEEAYEDAVDQGDSAVLLERAAPGLYTVNIANLMAGERATIRIRYAQLLRWKGDELRFQLPTTVAPRYGNPHQAGLEPHQVPETVLRSSVRFSLGLNVTGSLSSLTIASPSHSIETRSESASTTIHLVGGSEILDRDLVLNFSGSTEASSDALWAQDEDQYIALASFRLPPNNNSSTKPRNLVLVIDCSGSMAGDSVAQAKLAATNILDELRPDDHFNLIAFGSECISLFPERVGATTRNIDKARLWASKLDASMGGTEMTAALRAAYRQAQGYDKSLDVLLVTDGEIWNEGTLTQEAVEAGARVFVVGVGSAAAEALLSELSRATAGEVEFVVPREDMAEKIVRHFGRIHQPVAEDVTVSWPATTEWQAPETIPFTFAGDTLHVYARLAEPPAGDVYLNVQFRDGSSTQIQATFPTEPSSGDWLRRVAAAVRLRGLTKEDAEQLAVNHQLVTEFTSCTLILERAASEKANSPPALRKIPHTVAAGWGGMGRVGHATPTPVYSRIYRSAYTESHKPSRDSYMSFPIDYIENDALPVHNRRRVLEGLLSGALDPDSSHGASQSLADDRALIIENTVKNVLATFPELLELRTKSGLSPEILSARDLALCLVVVFGETTERHERRRFRELLKQLTPPGVLQTNHSLRSLLVKFLDEEVGVLGFLRSK